MNAFFDKSRHWLTWSFGLLTLTATLTAGAAKVCVNPTGSGGCVADISAAIVTAGDGGTVTLAPGIYRQTVVIATPNVTLKGNSSAIIDPDDPNSGPGIDVQANGVTLNGFSIRNGQSYGVHIASDKTNVTVLKLNIQAPAGGCIVGDGGNDHMQFVGNTLSACNSLGISAVGADVEIVGNKVTGCGSICINVIGNRVKVLKNSVANSISSCFLNSGTDIVIDKNVGSNCGASGIQIIGDNPVVTNNKIASASQYGINAICSGVLCSTAKIALNSVNSITAPGGFALFVQGGSSGMVVTKNSIVDSATNGLMLAGTGMTIANNKISGTGGLGTQGCINTSSLQHSTLSGNRVQNCVGNGIFVSGTDVTLNQNIVLGSTTNGYSISGSAITLNNNKASGTSAYGFRINQSSSNVQLTGNKAIGTVREGICKADNAAGITTDTDNNFGTELKQGAGTDCPASLAL